MILKNVIYWLNANKILLNVKKTEFVIFKQQRKKLDSPIKINLNCKRLYPSKSVIYLSIKIKLNLAIKLNRANALLFTSRNYVKHILRTIYFAIFDSHINYTNLIWGQNLNAVNRIVNLQKKALRIIFFQSRDSHSSLVFKSNYILKLVILKLNSYSYHLSLSFYHFYFVLSVNLKFEICFYLEMNQQFK